MQKLKWWWRNRNHATWAVKQKWWNYLRYKPPQDVFIDLLVVFAAIALLVIVASIIIQTLTGGVVCQVH